MKDMLTWLSTVNSSTMIAVLALVVSLIVMFFNSRQLSLLVRQLRLDSLIKISDCNRQLVSLGFAKPELWKALNESTDLLDGKTAEDRRRYLQLWFNHMHVIWKAHRLGLLDRDEWNACRVDLIDSLRIRYLRTHWSEVKEYYPKAFQCFVDDRIKEGDETPQRGGGVRAGLITPA